MLDIRNNVVIPKRSISSIPACIFPSSPKVNAEPYFTFQANQARN